MAGGRRVAVTALACVESHHWFWGTPRILQNSLPLSNRTRFPRLLDRPSSLPEFSTTEEKFSKRSFRNTQVEGILNRLGFHTGLDELRAERVANARIAADLAAAAEAQRGSGVGEGEVVGLRGGGVSNV